MQVCLPDAMLLQAATPLAAARGWACAALAAVTLAVSPATALPDPSGTWSIAETRGGEKCVSTLYALARSRPRSNRPYRVPASPRPLGSLKPPGRQPRLSKR